MRCKDGWSFTNSSYKKLKISLLKFEEYLIAVGFDMAFNRGIDGSCDFVANKI
ncbi:MAG: hypothetical protein MI748_17880 [Opitutales bacterium]|nr:hypothetical protein [Opitutales bacterium]